MKNNLPFNDWIFFKKIDSSSFPSNDFYFAEVSFFCYRSNSVSVVENIISSKEKHYLHHFNGRYIIHYTYIIITAYLNLTLSQICLLYGFQKHFACLSMVFSIWRHSTVIKSLEYLYLSISFLDNTSFFNVRHPVFYSSWKETKII